nr:MAG TPA: hypothetical protein [Caudoviricetes sp.]
MPSQNYGNLRRALFRKSQNLCKLLILLQSVVYLKNAFLAKSAPV